MSLPRLSARLGIVLGTDRGEAGRSAGWCEVPESARHVLASVDAVLARWPSGSECLVRALACGFLLRAQRVTLRIGIPRTTAVPFSGHAWLELDGVALPEPRGRAASFDAFRRLGKF